MASRPQRIETQLVHAGEPEPRVMGAVSMPIFQSSTYETGEGAAGYHSAGSSASLGRRATSGSGVIGTRATWGSSSRAGDQPRARWRPARRSWSALSSCVIATRAGGPEDRAGAQATARRWRSEPEHG